MGIELLILGVALALVGLTRGSYKNLFSTKINHWWALIPVLIGLLVVEFAPIKESQYDSIGISILLGTYVFLFGFLWANLNLKGMWIALVGLSMNAIVIALNLGMPVTTSGNYEVVESIKHQPATSSDLMGFFGDIIPINFASIAISIGDIIFAFGICAVFIFASRSKQTAQSESENEAVETEAVDTEAVEADSKRNSPENEIEMVKPKEVTPAVASSPMKKSVSNDRPKIKSAKPLSGRKARRWQKTHGLNALPSKEELGFDEESMEIVEGA